MQQLQPLPQVYPKSSNTCTARSGLSLIVLEQRRMSQSLDLVGRTFMAVARLNIEVLLISKSSSDGNFCFVIPQEHAQTVANTLRNELAAEVVNGEQFHVRIVHDVTLLTAPHHAHAGPVSAAVICSALAKQAINILVVTQGTSTVSLIINAENAPRAIDALNRL